MGDFFIKTGNADQGPFLCYLWNREDFQKTNQKIAASAAMTFIHIADTVRPSIFD